MFSDTIYFLRHQDPMLSDKINDLILIRLPIHKCYWQHSVCIIISCAIPYFFRVGGVDGQRDNFVCWGRGGGGGSRPIFDSFILLCEINRFEFSRGPGPLIPSIYIYTAFIHHFILFFFYFRLRLTYHNSHSKGAQCPLGTSA